MSLRSGSEARGTARNVGQTPVKGKMDGRSVRECVKIVESESVEGGTHEGLVLIVAERGYDRTVTYEAPSIIFHQSVSQSISMDVSTYLGCEFTDCTVSVFGVLSRCPVLQCSHSEREPTARQLLSNSHGIQTLA